MERARDERPYFLPSCSFFLSLFFFSFLVFLLRLQRATATHGESALAGDVHAKNARARARYNSGRILFLFILRQGKNAKAVGAITSRRCRAARSCGRQMFEQTSVGRMLRARADFARYSRKHASYDASSNGDDVVGLCLPEFSENFHRER